MRLVVDIGPFGMMLLLLAFRCNLIHEVLDDVRYVLTEQNARLEEKLCPTYPCCFKRLELELSFQPLSFVTHGPPSVVDQFRDVSSE